MMIRAQQQPAYVLHSGHYRETSLLLEVFTRQHGRLGLVAKGARRPKSPWRGALNPFQPLLIGWAGRGELATLTAAEADGEPGALAGQALYCGFYLNELLVRLLHRHDPHEALFDRYRACLRALAGGGAPDSALRVFEKHLLGEIGYGLVLDREAGGGAPLDPDTLYDYLPERGPLAIGTGAAAGVPVHGASLKALAEERFPDARSLHEAKAVMRACLARYLGPRPLHSRRLFPPSAADTGSDGSQ
jgi:DNA repair protein RecO (recombination protein O)